MAYGTRVAFESVRELAFGSITGVYAALGTPLTHHARLIRIVNTTNQDVYVSTDGVNNMIRMASGSFFVLDLTTNRVSDDGLFLPIGTQFYVVQQSVAPTSGAVWAEVVYAQGGV